MSNNIEKNELKRDNHETRTFSNEGIKKTIPNVSDKRAPQPPKKPVKK